MFRKLAPHTVHTTCMPRSKHQELGDWPRRSHCFIVFLAGVTDIWVACSTSQVMQLVVLCLASACAGSEQWQCWCYPKGASCPANVKSACGADWASQLFENAKAGESRSAASPGCPWSAAVFISEPNWQKVEFHSCRLNSTRWSKRFLIRRSAAHLAGPEPYYVKWKILQLSWLLFVTILTLLHIQTEVGERIFVFASVIFLVHVWCAIPICRAGVKGMPRPFLVQLILWKGWRQPELTIMTEEKVSRKRKQTRQAHSYGNVR